MTNRQPIPADADIGLRRARLLIGKGKANQEAFELLAAVIEDVDRVIAPQLLDAERVRHYRSRPSNTLSTLRRILKASRQRQSQPEIDRRGDAAGLCRALCAARRHAFRVQSVRGIYARCDRQQGLRGQGQIDDAGAGYRGRQIIWNGYGGRPAQRRHRRGFCRHLQLRALADRRAATTVAAIRAFLDKK
jgi:hypothetical protein